ncbi:sulfatase-like hydrolase/transferase [Crateriforma conspicua]|uniref:sulfatase-like hydrolase/transferase n=1 Tax=Crateriforma conspicua TaxID=2527996 RepID=UPI00118B497A|nr:sulfatase-like hydrolase/transferase [Crateriforma conspicua]QDV66043.1 Arylsulfatase [Crateriforma conspicua]
MKVESRVYPKLRLAVVACVLFFPWQVGADDRPNVILIMADDVSWECFGCYGGEDYETPNINRLAAQGIRFEHCYSTPICTPSRVKIMTGKYGFRNYTHFGYLHPDERTFGHMMQDAGYQTAIAGKWQLNGLYNSLPGNQDSTRPMNAGFHESLLWQVTRGKAGDGGERFWDPPLEHNGNFITKAENAGKYGPDLLTDFVCDFVQRNRDKPFFVYYPMVLVHDPFVPTPDTVGDQAITHALNKAPKGAKARKANFVAMVQYMDKLIGRIADKVDSLGLGEETIILFTADNGTNTSIRSRWNGTEIQGGKAGMKDNGTHVPLVARWKGHTPKGSVLSDLVDFTDFYATLSDVAGRQMSADDPIDGRSFFPQLNGQPGNLREWVLCHYQCYWKKNPGQYARTAQYKLYRDGRYYQIPVDLDESNDLGSAISGEAANVRKELEHLLNQCPPVPPGALDKNTKVRPTYPKTPNLFAQ